jgi:TetR/AcrR family transcriptional repressor of nem operon
MRYPNDQKEITRQRIVAAAATVFRRQGYRAAGVDAVMAEAGLTAGAFYAHFPSKAALLAEVLAFAISENRPLLEHGLADVQDCEWVRTVARRYLSPTHRRLVEKGCPLPALLPEIGRADEAAKRGFESLLHKMAGRISERLPATEGHAADEQALGLLALLVGGITLARAVADEAFADQILAACRGFVETGLAEKPAASTVPSPRRRKKQGAAPSVRRQKPKQGESDT